MEETLWETKHRIEDIIKMDLKEMGYYSIDCTCLSLGSSCVGL
jgi:hypothetical protein